MARRKNPLDKLVSAATDALKDPRGAAGKAVEQAKESAAVGRMVAGQVGRAAVTKAAETAGVVTGRAPRRTSADAPRASTSRPAPPPKQAPVEEPAKKAAAKKTVKTAPARKTPAKKTSAKKTPAKKAPAKKTPAKKTPAKKTPAKKAAVKKTAKKTAAKKAPAPLTAQQVADVEDGPEVTTPVGTAAADVATNPDTTDTDLQQPGTEPLLDPGTAKALRSESETLRKGAQTGDEQASEQTGDEAVRDDPEQPGS